MSSSDLLLAQQELEKQLQQEFKDGIKNRETQQVRTSLYRASVYISVQYSRQLKLIRRPPISLPRSLSLSLTGRNS